MKNFMSILSDEIKKLDYDKNTNQEAAMIDAMNR